MVGVGVESVGTMFNYFPIFINDCDSRIAHNYTRILIQDRHTFFQEVECLQIIVSDPFEVFGSGQSKCAPVVGIHADVRIVAMVTNSAVSGGIVTADLFGPIRGSVVRNDEFEIGKRLLENGFNRFYNKSLAVVNR